MGGCLAVLLLTTGCGGTSTTSTPATAHSSKSGSYRERVDSCLRNVGYQTRSAGNAMRVERPDGRLIANVQTFKTAKRAHRFADGLVVAGAWGGRGVAVFLRDADSDAKAVVKGCLTP